MRIFQRIIREVWYLVKFMLLAGGFIFWLSIIYWPRDFSLELLYRGGWEETAIDRGLAEQLWEKYRSGVVTVRTKRGSGSGFALSSRYVITANHVVSDDLARDGEISVNPIAPTGVSRYTYVAQVIARDEENDLALLQILEELQVVPLYLREYRSEWPSPGAWAMAIGSPGDSDGSLLQGSAKEFRFLYADHDIWRSDRPFLPGFSGSPILDGDGQVVGIVTRGAKYIGGGTSYERIRSFLAESGVKYSSSTQSTLPPEQGQDSGDQHE